MFKHTPAPWYQKIAASNEDSKSPDAININFDQDNTENEKNSTR